MSLYYVRMYQGRENGAVVKSVSCPSDTRTVLAAECPSSGDARE
jgi:hypothetical protein